jgi:arsenate reductase
MLLDAGSGPRLRDGLREVGPHLRLKRCDAGDQQEHQQLAAMAEKGIDISNEQPKRWSMDMLEAVDVVSMGCGDACPILPGCRREEWVIPDPAGKSVEQVRPVRDEIEQRVRTLLDQLLKSK